MFSIIYWKYLNNLVKMSFICGDSRAVKWNSLKSYWLSAFAGSIPVPRRNFYKDRIVQAIIKIMPAPNKQPAILPNAEPKEVLFSFIL